MGDNLNLQTNVDTSKLQVDPDKKTVLVVSDSAAIHSGFAQVVRNVFGRLWPERKWNIIQYGWWHSNPVERVKWDIVTTNRDPSNPNLIDQADKYGQHSFEGVVGSVRPDLVWVMGDPWMIQSVIRNQHRSSYTAVLYTPVDGAPLKYGWDIVEHFDVVVPYLPWGSKMIKRWCPKANVVDHIPHGVDTDLYKPVDPESRQAFKHRRTNLGPDDITMLSVSRNQARKNLPALLELTYYIRSGDYRVCQVCGRAYRNPYNYHLGRPSGKKGFCPHADCNRDGHKLVDGKPNPKFYYCMHTPIKDIEAFSWNLIDVLDTFGFRKVDPNDSSSVTYPGVLWNENVQIVHGIPEEDMAQMYASADIFALATTGEGFGLPILEAMSCGTPVVVPDVSSHPDFVQEGGGMLVDIGYHVCEVASQYYRGYPDLDDYLTKVLLLVNNAKLRKQLGNAARETATRYGWDNIARQWEELIDGLLTSGSASKRWQRVTTI
jgi:glycosyltransferase involved in cell wall biosynthesis